MPRRDWAWLVRWLAAAILCLTAVVGLVSGDRETLVIAAALLVANALLRWRTGFVGTILTALLATDIAFWMLPAALTNLANGESLAAVVVPAAFATSAVLLLVAATLSLARRRHPEPAGVGPLIAVGAAMATLALATLVGLLGATDGPATGDVQVTARDTAFEPDHLDVPAGRTTFYVTNDDLFWHTFTIKGTSVNVRLSTRGHRRVEVDLAPGTYEIVCRIPGHESLGMTGTLAVQ